MEKKLWHCHVKTRFSSCSWDFDSWNDCINYARHQHTNCVLDVARFPTYVGILSDYRAVIKDDSGTTWTLFSEYFE
jgi:hypothetical protein